MALNLIGIKKKLLASSYLKCEYFYVGPAGLSPNDPVGDRHYKIENKEDFLNGSFEDLMDLARLGISYKEPSLYLVEPARKMEKENREKSLGLRAKVVHLITLLIFNF
jgi:hypothetical protein